MVQSCKDQDKAWTSIVLNQSHGISSLKSVTSWRKDITGVIQPKFVYQSTSLDYYEPTKSWEVEENTNIDVLEETEDNYLWSCEYAKAQVNVLDEVP